MTFLRNGHGKGKGTPHIEVSPADELPAPVTTALAPPAAPLNFRDDGRIADSATARELGRRGGAAKARRVRLGSSFANDSRQNLLAGYELAVREAKARGDSAQDLNPFVDGGA
jgi:general stress protein YciG